VTVFGSDTSIAIGRVAGVPVRMGPGAALLAGALTVLLGARWTDAGGGATAYLFAGLAAAGFLVSILLHELSHALVARRFGVKVSEIRLILFGGLARLERQAPSPRAEMSIAVAGPLASLGVAVVGVGAALALRSQGVGGVGLGALAWVAVINGILGGFNLLPALPLDGGRILTGWLWRRSGDRAKATQSAARAGRFLGIGLIGLGAGEIVLFQSLTGIWTALIGNLLVTAARSEGRHADLVRSVRGRTVAEAMGPRPATVALGTRAAAARALLPPPDRQRWAVAVDDDGVARGLVDLLALDRVADARGEEPVDQVVLPVDQRRAAYADEDLEEVLARVEGLPLVVIDSQWRAVGVLSELRLRSTTDGPNPLTA
jgi:Zn-dependent protease